MGKSRAIASIVACALLAACGSGDSVTVEVAGSPGKVATPLMMASVNDAASYLPGLKVARTQPDEHELKFTFPGDGKYEPATILFDFTPANGGKSTKVHAAVHVPEVVAMIDGKKKMLSEYKVTSALDKILRGMARGESAESTTTQMSAILVALAVSTDAPLRDRAMAMAKDPSSILRDLLDSEGSAGEEVAVADHNDPTEFNAPRDESEQFSPDRDTGPAEGDAGQPE